MDSPEADQLANFGTQNHSAERQRRSAALLWRVLAQLFDVFNARSDRRSAFHQLFTNPLLWGAIALSIVLQVAVVQVPFMNDAFKTSPLNVGDWLICAGLASPVLWAGETKKIAAKLLFGSTTSVNDSFPGGPPPPRFPRLREARQVVDPRRLGEHQL